MSGGPIYRFTGEFEFLSNFYASPVSSPEDAISYPTVEHAFQAAKSTDVRDRLRIAGLPTSGDAKRAGRVLTLREDWEDVKRVIMLRLVLDKFTRHEDLAEKLAATGERLLIEGNSWGDDYWGMVKRDGTWQGFNYLGTILMAVRMVL